MTTNDRIQITPDIAFGKPRIADHRITVQDVAIWHVQMGMSLEEIAAEYDLTQADVHAALAYYFEHHEEIDRRIAEGIAFAEEMRKKTPSKLAQKLEKLRKNGPAH